MDADKWSIVDDCAHWLCSNDLDAGRKELHDRIAHLERWFTDRRNFWQKVKVTTATCLAVSGAIAVWMLGSQGSGSGDTAIGLSAAAFALAAIAWNFPRIVQQYPFDWSKRQPFSDPRIEQLRDYLRDLAASHRRVFTRDGRSVDTAILKQDWALLYLTTSEDLYGLPVLAGPDVWLKHYEGGLFVEKPPQPPALSEPEHSAKVFVYVDQRSSKTTVNQHVELSEAHTHLHFVTQLRADIARTESPPSGSGAVQQSSRENAKRWPCEFDDDDYEIRLLIFKTKTLPNLAKVESHQIEKYIAVVDAARRIWTADPRMTIEQAAEQIGPLVAKNSNGHSGLNLSSSVAWIRSVIGGTGKYAFIKDAFKSIQYEPEEFGSIQYRLLLQ